MARNPTKTTEKTTAAPARAARATATETTAGPSFDARANKSALLANRRAGVPAGGEKTATFTVAAGQSLRFGGERKLAGDTVELGEVDAERLLAKGVVAKGKVKVDATTAEDRELARRTAEEKAADEQRKVDEQAAADKEAANLAAGKLSGAENR